MLFRSWRMSCFQAPWQARAPCCSGIDTQTMKPLLSASTQLHAPLQCAKDACLTIGGTLNMPRLYSLTS